MAGFKSLLSRKSFALALAAGSVLSGLGFTAKPADAQAPVAAAQTKTASELDVNSMFQDLVFQKVNTLLHSNHIYNTDGGLYNEFQTAPNEQKQALAWAIMSTGGATYIDSAANEIYATRRWDDRDVMYYVNAPSDYKSTIDNRLNAVFFGMTYQQEVLESAKSVLDAAHKNHQDLKNYMIDYAKRKDRAGTNAQFAARFLLGLPANLPNNTVALTH